MASSLSMTARAASSTREAVRTMRSECDDMNAVIVSLIASDMASMRARSCLRS